jgi:hypothetical protein
MPKNYFEIEPEVPSQFLLPHAVLEALGTSFHFWSWKCVPKNGTIEQNAIPL